MRKFLFSMPLFLLVSTIATVPTFAQENIEIQPREIVNTIENIEPTLIKEEIAETKEKLQDNIVIIDRPLVFTDDVNDDFIVLGTEVQVDSNINGNIIFLGGLLVINGNVEGNITALGGAVYINSEFVNGNLTIAGAMVSIDSETVINGEQKINSLNNEIISSENPTDLDSVESIELVYPGGVFGSIFSGINNALRVISIAWSILMLLGSIILGMFIFKFFPAFSTKSIKIMKEKPGQSMIAGLTVIVSSVFIAILLFVTIVGIPLLGLLILLALLASALGGVYVRFIVGEYLLNYFKKENVNVYLTYILGLILIDGLFILLAFVPFLDFIAQLISLSILALGMGGIVYNKFLAINKK